MSQHATTAADAAPSPVSAPMSFGRHMARTVRLAAPVVAARAGLLIMVAVDTAMVGHYGTTDLAFYAAANAVQIVMILIGVGFLQGTVILVSQAHGAGGGRECGAYLWAGIAHGIVLGVLMGVLCLFGEWFLAQVGQEAVLVIGGGGVLDMLSWGFPALMMWVASAFFLEGLSRPLPGMLVMFAAVLLNALLNWLFIFGHWGAPEMGAEGAALATGVIRWVMFLALVGYILALRDGRALGVHGPIEGLRAASRKLRRIGYPLGAARGFEAAAFSALTMLAGHVGTGALAAYQIAFNLVALVFMCAIGTSAATTIRVGNAVGRRNPTDISRAGWAGVATIVGVMLCFAGPFLGLGAPLASLYTNDPAVVPIAAGLIAIAGFFLVFDGAQAVLMGALRGVTDIWLPSGLQLIAWWCVSVPLGYVLAFEAGLGVDGLMWGILAGAATATALLSVRFRGVSRRPVARY